MRSNKIKMAYKVITKSNELYEAKVDKYLKQLGATSIKDLED